MSKPRSVILKERVRILDELINKAAESSNPHENDFVYSHLYYLRKEIKEEVIQLELQKIDSLKEAAEQYAARHPFDGDQLELYVECHNGKIEAYHSGAYWGRGQMLKKWESLIGYIDLINHSSLTKDQHEVLDKILEESKVTEDELRRIRLVYNPNNPT